MERIEFYPRILPAGIECEVSAKLASEIPLTESPRFLVSPMEGISGEAVELPAECVTVASGNIRMRLQLPAEQEYQVEIRSERIAGKDKRLARGRVYALQQDLIGLRPWKGDFHMHSVRSDGKDLPSEVAVACRGTGLDFMALTDHGSYEPSLEAMQPFDGIEMGLTMFPGEEVHPPDNPVHMINFGGRASVNDLFKDTPYRNEVRDIATGLDGFTSDAMRYQYASCLWSYEKIRSLGGLAVFCHPYWNCGGRYNVCEELIARHFRDRPFDAYEVIGGYHFEEYEANTLQGARYHTERMLDPNLPIVGASDAHGCNTGSLFGWYHTIVFAVSSGLDDIISGVRELRSVAVAMLPGRPSEVIGPFRLVKLALFLMREYMPGHDQLCAEDCEVMQRCLKGDKDASADLRESARKVEDYHKGIWACM